MLGLGISSVNTPVLTCRSRNKKGRSALKTGARDRFSSNIAAKIKVYILTHLLFFSGFIYFCYMP